MTLFCENCGSKLPLDASFCENCGHNVSFYQNDVDDFASYEENLTVFTRTDWVKIWDELLSSGKYETYGIILTNTSSCPDRLKEKFQGLLKGYITFKAQSGVCYCVLDMAEQAVMKRTLFGGNSSAPEFVVKVLREICNVAEPEFLFILGDRDCIGSAKWKNLLNNSDGDSDKYVDSDLPYITLNTESPFEYGSQIFTLRAGRVPAVAKNGMQEACVYLKNAMIYSGYDTATSFALSAFEWKNVSMANFRNILPDLYTCPPNSLVQEMSRYDMDILSNDAAYNLLCFNLHGSPTHHYWLSGDGSLAYSPRSLPSREDVGYVLCTEACYGAKPTIAEQGDQSILVSALANRCLGFVGSTQIAYGMPDSGLLQGHMPCCADILIGEFSEWVSKGLPLGQAFVNALCTLSGVRSPLNAEEIKTIASFALYGDPSLSLLRKNEGAVCHASHLAPHAFSHIAMPDIRQAVHMRLTAVSRQLSEKMSRAIAKFNEGMADVTPQYYTVSGYDGYKAVCKKSTDNTSDILSIYFDKDGKIENVYVSK